MMDYACPAWKSAAHNHVRKLQVLQSKCLRLAIGSSWYVINRQIHEGLGVPMFADHITALTESFDSKLANVGTPLYGNSADTVTECWPRCLARRPRAVGDSRPVEAVGSNGQVDLTNGVRCWSGERPSVTLTEGFPCFFLSCKANARVYDAKSRHGPHSPPTGSAVSPSHTSSFRQSFSGLRTQTAIQPKFIPPILSPGQPRP